MSRYTSMTAIYSVEVSPEIAKQIYENHFNDNFMAFTMNPLALDEMADDEADETLCGMMTEDSPYKGHSKNEHTVFELMLLTHNENSHKEVDQFYDPKNAAAHYFGITIADSGYGDKIGAFTGNIPQEAIDNYEKYAKPILERYEINTQPQVEVVQYTC